MRTRPAPPLTALPEDSLCLHRPSDHRLGRCDLAPAVFRLVWLWFREGRPLAYGIAGAAILILYGIIPTFQPAHFGHVYAAYGGMFIALSLYGAGVSMGIDRTAMTR